MAQFSPSSPNELLNLLFTRPRTRGFIAKPAFALHSTEKWRVDKFCLNNCSRSLSAIAILFQHWGLRLQACVCAASLSQKDKCGFHQMYFAQASMQDRAHIFQLDWMDGLVKKDKNGRGSGSVVHELWIYGIWDNGGASHHCAAGHTHVQCSLYIIYCTKGIVDPRWWQCHHSGGHRDQNRMLLWPTSAILHSPHLQLAQGPDHRNIYLILLGPDCSLLLQCFELQQCNASFCIVSLRNAIVNWYRRNNIICHHFFHSHFLLLCHSQPYILQTGNPDPPGCVSG